MDIRHKFNSDASFEQHKARLVYDDRGQQIGFDCDETFNIVVKPTMIHISLGTTTSLSCPIYQLDIKTFSFMVIVTKYYYFLILFDFNLKRKKKT